MRKLAIITLFPLLMASLLITSTLPATQRGIRVKAKSGESLYLYKDYHALVVGVSHYDKWPDLPNAIKDARMVATTLKGFDFTVKLLLNPTSTQLNAALTRIAFGVGEEKNRALLFYYAGHGEILELADGTELGYIIPSDCPLKTQDPTRFDQRAISMKQIESLALKIKSKHCLMVFDSCFSGSLFSLVRAAPTDISEKSTRSVRQFITAGEAGEQVPDKSVFKVVFLDGVIGDADLNDDGYVTGSELGMYLQGNVVNYTRGGQHPQYGKINNPKLDKGDFIFSLDKLNAPPQSSPSTPLESEKQRLAEERTKIERERQKIEQLKMEIEREKLEKELNRLKAEKQKLEEAKLPSKHKHPPSVSTAKKDGEIARDGRFIAYDNGTVLDTKTNLIWAAKDNGDGLREYAARDYIKTYRGGGYTDWRMPTMDELKTIYERAMKNQHDYHVTKLIDITDEWVWDSDGWGNIDGFSFLEGSRAVGDDEHSMYWTAPHPSARVLPARAGN